MNFKFSELLNALLAAAAFVIIVAGIQAASPIIIPFLLAVFIASLCAPLLYWLQRRRVPNALAVLIIFLGLLVIAILLMTFAGRSLNSLSRQLPTYQERLAGLITSLYCLAEQSGAGY